MKVKLGIIFSGPLVTATELIYTLDQSDPLDWTGSIGTWFIDAPGQSIAWQRYLLSCVHLRPIAGESRPVQLKFPGATHELVMAALDPETKPDPLKPETMRILHPLNLCEQIIVGNDAQASEILALCARCVAEGKLWAEPPLSGQREPWGSFLKLAQLALAYGGYLYE